MKINARSAGLVAIAMLVASVAYAEDKPCSVLDALLTQPLPREIKDLETLKKVIQAQITACKSPRAADAPNSEGERSKTLRQAWLHGPRIEIALGEAMGATGVVAETDAPPAKKKKASKPGIGQLAAKKPVDPERKPPARRVAEEPTPKPKPKGEPETPANRQATAAVKSAKETWQLALDELANETDKARQKEAMSFYAMAAITYLQALTLWQPPSSSDYAEIVAPLINDPDAQSRLAIETSGTQIRQMLKDPETAKAIKAYVATSITLGRTVSEERAQAMHEWADNDFSKDGLDGLVRAWGQQQLEGLAREFMMLLTQAERLKTQVQLNNQLFVMAGVSATSQQSCAATTAEKLTEQLAIIYGDRFVTPTGDSKKFDSATLVEPVGPDETMRAFGARVDRSFREHYQKGKCTRCDAAFGILMREEGDALVLEATFSFPNATRLEDFPRRVVRCGEAGAALAAASQLVQELLKQVTLVNDQSPPIFVTSGTALRIRPPITVSGDGFTCGSAETPLPPVALRRRFTISSDCNRLTTEAVRDNMNALGYLAAVGATAAPDDPVLRLTAAEGRCYAALQIGKHEYLTYWADTSDRSNAPPDAARDPGALDIDAGHKLSTCLSAYYLTSHVSEPPVVVTKTVPDESPAASLLLPGSEWWDDSDGGAVAGGVVWSVADLALLGGGVLLIGLSIDERNEFAENSGGSLTTASRLQWTGAALLGAFVVERVVWAIAR